VRFALTKDVPPEAIRFGDAAQESFFEIQSEPVAQQTTVTVPKAFLNLAEVVAMHRDSRRWDLLYRTLYRIVRRNERHLLELEIDPDVRELVLMEKAVGRDIHRMHAFVRFRKVPGEPEQYVAWHRPDHYIVGQVGPWFVRRFGAMRWAILTPDRSAYWDMQTLRFGPGVSRSEAPASDDLEELWCSYYASIFNPARANLNAMVRELPVRHRATLPEAGLIPRLLMEAAGREKDMRESKPPSAVPKERRLPVLATAVRECQGCELYRNATQAVFGEGPPRARVMLVGEQPGDQEDLQGRPFVGPAGQLLDRALDAAGIARREVYLTNAVKHFRYEAADSQEATTGWRLRLAGLGLSAEIEAMAPEVIVALGASGSRGR
jgi:DNA polymerase